MQGDSNGEKKAQEPQNQAKRQEPSHAGGASAQAEKSANSPTAGIADGFIEELLAKYFQSGK